MTYEPVSEMGVLALFAMLAEELGIVFECVGAGFPDIIAKRRDPKTGRHTPILIEAEFKSSNFVRHGHSPDGCNMVVCWLDDWAERPPGIEVLCLKRYLRERAERLYRSEGFTQPD